MRCGSTWLYQVLQCHPDVRMSDIKEVDFFFLHRMLHHDLGWYEALFETEGGERKPVRGEISPRYLRLKTWQVREVANFLPHLKIIVTLRHPIERIWSQTLYDFGHLVGRDVRHISSVEFLRQLERPRNRLPSDYARIIKTWSDAFGKTALHVSFFDDLRDEPQTYVNGVLKHIGASIPWTVPAKFLKKKVFATNSLIKYERKIPEIVQWYIADRWLAPTEQLNDLLDGRVHDWVEEMRDIRGRTRWTWRLLKELNRTLLSIPERLAFETYHLTLDARLWYRWQQLQSRYLYGANHRGIPQLGASNVS